MALKYHPEIGTIVICDFKGFVEPEITKRRPAIVVSPRFRTRGNLCSIVPLSTTAPKPPLDCHFRLYMDEALPEPYNADMHWVKADLVYTVSFERLTLPLLGKDDKGNRIYVDKVVDEATLKSIRKCILHGLGMPQLTEHLE